MKLNDLLYNINYITTNQEIKNVKITNITHNSKEVQKGSLFIALAGFNTNGNNFIQKANKNHFGFEDIEITEPAQFTEYPEGGFYEWHMDTDVNMAHEPPVRKISMTLLLSHESQFEGGDLEISAPDKFVKLKQGHAIIFASFLPHRVKPIIRGVRQSLVMWFGGSPLR